MYFKLETNHKENFTNPAKHVRNRGVITSRQIRRYQYIQKNQASFSQYFARYYKIPFDRFTRLAHHRLDYVMRFESLSRDFATVLERLGIEAVRSLAQENKTRRGNP